MVTGPWLDIVAVTGYGLVAAFTTMPIVSIIAILLGTRRVSRGVWFTVAYAVGLAGLFLAAAVGLTAAFDPTRFHISGPVEVFAGLVLIGFGLFWHLRQRRKARRTGEPPRSRLLELLTRIGPAGAAIAGLQFAFHPENLVLTVAASTHVRGDDWLLVGLMTAWYAVVGVSTVAVPTIIFAKASERAQRRLERIRDWVLGHGTQFTVVVLLAVGLLVLGFGIYHTIADRS